MTTLNPHSFFALIHEVSFGEYLKNIKMKNQNRTVMTLGTGSYVDNCLVEGGDLACQVLAGNYVCMADQILFLIGVDHHKDYATNYPFEGIHKEGMPNFTEEQTKAHKYMGGGTDSYWK